jgi:hypothetical protein
MEGVKQTKTGMYGNCLESCIASLTGIALNDFPELSNIESANGKWWGILNNWLKEKHKIYTEAMVFDRNNCNDHYTRGLVIAIGDSPSLKDELHAVIWDLDEDKMVFDPSPLNEGLKGSPKSYCMLINYYNQDN